MADQTIYLRYSSLSGDFRNLTNKAIRLLCYHYYLKNVSNRELACGIFWCKPSSRTFSPAIMDKVFVDFSMF